MNVNALLRALVPVAALAVSACSAHVIGGGGGSTSSEGTGSSTHVHPTPCDDCEPPPTSVPTAIAVTAAQLGYSQCGSGSGGTGGGASSGTTGSGGCGPDPATVYLEIGSPTPTCGNPQLPYVCGTYGVSISFPPAMLVPGTYALSDPGLNAFYSETGPSDPTDPSGQTCPGGGGSFVSGSITITEVDASQVSFSLTGTQGFDFMSGNADGSYVAERCP